MIGPTLPVRSTPVGTIRTAPDNVPAQLLAVWARLEPIQKVLERNLPILEDGVGELKKMVDDVYDELDRRDALRKDAEARRAEIRAEALTMLKNLVPELQKIAAGVADLKKTASSGGGR